ncbi:hypothetical protein U9M48_019341 [Paspalum notatum var. saurae]|uniref:Reverse transcriptase zinc-binding domain-containing protein n=1 Tax=Paspalum notatum var. saurae TaxID=547442 RepID=A0AAQ3TC76_PASNO
MLIYLAMAVDLPPWAIKAVDKIRRGFLWRGRKDARGGHCLVAWEKTCRPLQRMCWALQLRWLWLRKTEPDKPWSVFPIQVHKCAQALFSTTMVTEIGDGSTTLFWSDQWLLGKNIAELAPLVFALVPKRRIHKRTVLEALTDNTWLSNIQGALSVAVILEFLQLWDLFSEIVRIWRPWAPSKCQFFMWLVAHNRCWTADRLASRGLPHPTCCPLCDQQPETINHLLIDYVFAREFWFGLLRKVGLHSLAPQNSCPSFDDWWSSANAMVQGEARQGLNSVIILGA